MSTTAVPPKKTNRIGLEIAAYKGGKTTLCAGCGHNSVSERLVECFFEMGIEPWSVAKFSGIGCSSKSPAYFLGMAHGFNSVHGRAPSVATGALVANRNLLGVTVSGDGDTASIGIGQFVHMLRRNVRQIYIIENNGVYGLTKGQFSATADIGSKLKTGVVNDLPPIDCCLQAIHLGATLVARSFSGDKRQLQAILKAAIAHRGLSVIDVISPCVTFNDHEGSTKSYSYMKEHGEPLHELDFIPACEDIAVEIAEGEIREVEMHGGARLRLKKVGRDYDPTDKLNAVRALAEAEKEGHVLTGILYVDTSRPDFVELLNLVDEPLATLPESKVRPPREALDQIMDELR
ncbi:MAG TPA: 2-oxoacid:ferredoxin oxidoreductase subunit beta [Bryobacteraceae bacterium]|nr:2-oxoacid:ferredoxin oxidoreductase subunit beta [Bryobacteraceae bacterium]HOQ46224.1 2-oxoacid:ferredoxin oxidoreductase subunit beta [Bryobacteraceae bacterium]HPU73994.1 2-oxoacid:ferredoxin oxidoreductase subunit beta [Bryobacteraceae bacterium]